MRKYIIFTLFLFTLFFINNSFASADFPNCGAKTHTWPTETPGSTWSWTVTNRSEMLRGLESISGINSGTTYNASTGVFAGGDPTVFGLSTDATTAEVGVLVRQWGNIINKNTDSVLNGFYSTNPELKKIAMAEILNAVAVVGGASNAGRQYLAGLDGSKMTEVYNAYLVAYPTVSRDWINQLWNQIAPTCGQIIITPNTNTANNTPPPSEISTKFKIGDNVKTTSNLNVRSTPNGSVLGQQVANSQGSVIDGPNNTGGYNWWKINYQNGEDGWSAENYLVLFTLSLLATPATPSTNQNITFIGQTTPSQSQIKSSSEASSSSKGCFKYPDGSVIAQNMSDLEANYCIYLAKVSAEQQAKNYKRMGDVLAQYPDWKKCAADTSELRNVNSKLGYFGDILWQPPALGSSNYELYLKCKDAVEVLQYINKNRFEIHPAVWFYEKGFWIGVSNIVIPVWPPSDCVSCLSSSRATLNTDYNPPVSNLISPATLKKPASINALSAPTGRPTTSVPSYLGATPIERYPALSEAAIAQAQNSSDSYVGLKYKEVSLQALSSQEKTAVYSYIDDSNDLSTNPQQYFSPCGSLMTQYKTTGNVFLGRGPVYRSALNTCSSINSSFVPDDSSVRSYACENFLYKSRVVGRATFAFQCKTSN